MTVGRTVYPYLPGPFSPTELAKEEQQHFFPSPRNGAVAAEG
jgi:hypothetical protein